MSLEPFQALPLLLGAIERVRADAELRAGAKRLAAVFGVVTEPTPALTRLLSLSYIARAS